MSKGTMDPAAFAALSDADKMSAAISGNAAGLPSDFSGETLEEIANDLTGKLNLSGSAWLKAFFARVPFGKLGIKITSIGVSNLLFNWLLSLTSLPRGTKDTINHVGRNLLQGVLASYIDTSADRGNEDLDKAVHVGQTSQYVNKVSPYDPSKAMVVVISDLATGFKMIHAAAHENGAYLDIPDSGAPAVPATTCLHCENAYANHTATFRKETTTTGAGKDGKGGGTKVTAPPAYRNAKRMLLSDAEALSGIFYCPETWPVGRPTPAKAPDPSKTWKQKVGDEGILLFDAVLDYPRRTPSGIDNIKGPDIATEAVNVPIDEWADLAKQIIPKKDTAGVMIPVTGFYAGCWQEAADEVPATAAAKKVPAKEEGLTEKGFKLVLNKIVSRGNGQLRPENVVKVATLTIMEKFWREENRMAAWKALFAALGLTFAYLTTGVVALYFYGVSLFPKFDRAFTPDTVDGEVIGLFLTSITLLFWLVPWYWATGIQKIFAGYFKDELSAVAKGALVLLSGTASVSISIKLFGAWSTGTAFMPIMPITVFVLTAIAADRLASMWRTDETIAQRWSKLSLGKVNALSALGTAAIISMVFLIVVPWIAPKATFQVTVANKGGTFYVPTPKGKAFLPRDVIGSVEADAIETSLKAGIAQPVCLRVGTELDLPGYTESVQTPRDTLCAPNTASWVIRENFWGRAFDDGAKEYGSLAEMVADAQKADAALAEALKVPLTDAEIAAQAKAEAKAQADLDAKAKAKADAARIPAPTPTVAPPNSQPVATSEAAADKCARIARQSFTTRRNAGCVK